VLRWLPAGNPLLVVGRGGLAERHALHPTPPAELMLRGRIGATCSYSASTCSSPTNGDSSSSSNARSS